MNQAPARRPPQRAAFICFLVFSVVSLICFRAPTPGAASDIAFDSLLDEYLAGYWKANPAGAATPAGVHTYDAQLEDFSATAVQAEIQRTRSFLERFERLSQPGGSSDDPASLPLPRRVDLEMTLDHLRLRLLELEEEQPWKRNPHSYVALLGRAGLAMIQREFAPAERRFQSLAARLKLFPRVLEQARANLDNPPELFTRQAVELIPDTADFLERDLAQAAAEQGAARKTQRRVAQEAARAGAALRQFGKWLESDLLPRSRGTAELGAERYARKLRYSLGTSLTPEKLLAAAESDLRATQEQMQRLASRLAPQAAPNLMRLVLEQISPPQPAQKDLQAALRASLAEARRFVQEKRLAPLPRRDSLRTLPAPRLLPDGGLCFDAAGPFEPDMPSFLYFSQLEPLSDVSLIAIREGYPGRYAQLDVMNRAPRLARKVFESAAFIEGWALYAEQMMFEEGFRAEPRAHLFQLKNALQSQVLTIVDLRVHTGRLSRADAVKLLVEAGLYDPPAAESQVVLALLNPGRLSAAVAGKQELLRLREELRARRGPAFSLPEFHEELLSLGAPPLRHARALLLQLLSRSERERRPTS